MAKLTKKQYRRKRIFKGLAVFIPLVLIITGMAVWLLFSALNADLGGGIDVAKVAVSPMDFLDLKLNHTQVEEGKPTGANFVFDSAYGDDSGRVRWDSENSESLTVTVSGMLKNAQYLSSFVYTLELPEGVVEAARKGYVDIGKYYDAEKGISKQIAVPYTSENIRVAEDGVTSVLTFEFDVTLGWGEFFNFVNPSLYYDTEYYNADGTVDLSRGIHVSDGDMTAALDDLYSVIRKGETTLPEYTITLIAGVS